MGSRLLEDLICGPCIYECSTTKNYHPVRRPTMNSNLNNMVNEHHKRYGLFSDFHYGFSSSRSTSDILTIYLIDLLGLLIGPGLDI